MQAGEYLSVDLDNIVYTFKETLDGSSYNTKIYATGTSAATPWDTDQTLFSRSSFLQLYTYFSPWRYFHTKWSLANGLTAYVDNLQQPIISGNMLYDLSQNKQFKLILCPDTPGANTNPCNTVIAQIKIYKNFIDYSNICQYRLQSELTDRMLADWPLNYFNTSIFQDFIQDDSSSKMTAHYLVNSQSYPSRTIWKHITEIYPQAEDLVLCVYGQFFDVFKGQPVDQYGELEMIIYKGSVGLPLDYSYAKFSKEWTLGFWFKITTSYFNPDLSMDNHLIAYHDYDNATGCTDSTTARLRINAEYDSVSLARALNLKIVYKDFNHTLLTDPVIVKDNWFMINIVSDYFTQEVRTYISNVYNQVSSYPNTQFDYLSKCPLYFGENTGNSNPQIFQLLNYLSIREFKIWNEAKSYEDLIYNSIQPLYKKSTNSVNLAVYYKFVSQNTFFYDSVYFPDRYLDITTTEAGQKGIADWTTREELFTMDCSPGMTGSVQGCMSYQNWIAPYSNQTLNTQMKYDIGNIIKKRVEFKDVELTFSILSTMLQVSQSYTIAEIQNLVTIRRSSQQIVVEFTQHQVTTQTSTYNFNTNQLFYLFIIIDQVQNQLAVYVQDQLEISNAFFNVTLNKFQSSYNLIIGDESGYTFNHAYSHMALFQRVLTVQEMSQITKGGLRSIYSQDQSVLNYYALLNSKDYSTSESYQMYDLKQNTWPLWQESSYKFTTYNYNNRIQICPHGYRLHASYLSSNTLQQSNLILRGQEYAYCIERGSIVLRNGAILNLNINQPVIRYAWSLLFSFKIKKTSGLINLFEMQNVMLAQVDSGKLKVTIYSHSHVPQVIATNINVLTDSWYQFSATLFNFYWKISVDPTQTPEKIPDLLINYKNSALIPISTLKIDLSNSNQNVLAISKFLINAFPITQIDFNAMFYQGSFNKRQWQSQIKVHYDFATPFFQYIYDQSFYGSNTYIDPARNDITWAYDSDDSMQIASTDVNYEETQKKLTVSKDKSLFFDDKTYQEAFLSSEVVDSEHTIEFCFNTNFNQDPSIEVYLLKLVGMVDMPLYNFPDQILRYKPYVLFPNFQMTIKYELRKWECITAANSFERRYSYLANFLKLPVSIVDYYSDKLNDLSVVTQAFITGNMQVMIGKRFLGGMREVRIWNTFLNPGIGRRMTRSVQYSKHNPYLQSYFRLNDGIGDTLKDIANGEDVTNTNSLWLLIEDEDMGRLEICEGENVFSEQGFCLSKEKFLKMGTQSISITIQNGINYDPDLFYNVLSHSTISLWANFKIMRVMPSQIGGALMQLNVQNRYSAQIDKDLNFGLKLAVGNVQVFQNISMSNMVNQWIYISISCSYKTTKCTFFANKLMDDMSTFNTTSLNYSQIQPELQMLRTNLLSCQVILTPSIEPGIDTYFREFQIHQIQIPHVSQMKKVTISNQARQLYGMVVQLKMDEMSGTRLYNHATDIYNTVAYVDVSDIEWVYFKDTIGDQNNIQYFDPIDYMFCNKENYTHIGDHCEFYQCNATCYVSGYIGQCTGWKAEECITVDASLTPHIQYYTEYNDYLECYSYCGKCERPWENEQCDYCKPGYYLYIDERNLGVVKNGSCYKPDECPPTTYPNLSSQRCLDCSDYCLCTALNVTDCLSCYLPYPQLLFDNQKERCYKQCPFATIYIKETELCADCSKNCTSCSGTAYNECGSCKDGFYLAGFAPAVCEPIQCEKNQFFNWTSFECITCMPECGSCNETSSNCLTCAGNHVKNYLDAANKTFQCMTCYDLSVEEPKYLDRYLPDKDSCDEVCGDGFNMGVYPCDDGNTDDGDGCNQFCEVEKNWVAQGGNSQQSDQTKYVGVVSTAASEVSSSSSGSTGYFDIRFNVPMKAYSASLIPGKDILLTIVGSKAPYYYDYNIKLINKIDGSQVIRISYSLYFSTSSINPEQFLLSFARVGIMTGFNGKVQNGLDKFYFKVPTVAKSSSGKAQIASVMQSFEKIMLAVMITNLVLSTVLGEGLQHMWNLINYLQILFFLPLIGINFHQLSKDAFMFLAFTTADFFSKLPQMFDKLINFERINWKQLNERYTDLSIENALLIGNYYQKLQVFCAIGISYPFIYAMTKVKYKLVSAPFKFMWKGMIYNFPLQFLNEMYLELAVCVWINVVLGMQFRNIDQMMASGIAILIMSFVTIYPIMNFSIIMKKFDSISSEHFEHRFGSIIEQTRIQRNKTINQMWNPIFLFRRYTYAAILVVGDSQPVGQLVFSASQTIMTILFLLTVRPFVNMELNLLFMINELSCLVAFIVSFVFINEYTEEEGTKISWTIIAMVGFGIAINFVFVIKDLFQKIIKSLKNLFSNMKNIKAKIKAVTKRLREIRSGKEEDNSHLTEADKQKLKYLQQLKSSDYLVNSSQAITNTFDQSFRDMHTNQNNYTSDTVRLVTISNHADVNNPKKKVIIDPNDHYQNNWNKHLKLITKDYFQQQKNQFVENLQIESPKKNLLSHLASQQINQSSPKPFEVDNGNNQPSDPFKQYLHSHQSSNVNMPMFEQTLSVNNFEHTWDPQKVKEANVYNFNHQNTNPYIEFENIRDARQLGLSNNSLSSFQNSNFHLNESQLLSNSNQLDLTQQNSVIGLLDQSINQQRDLGEGQSISDYQNSSYNNLFLNPSQQNLYNSQKLRPHSKFASKFQQQNDQFKQRKLKLKSKKDKTRYQNETISQDPSLANLQSINEYDGNITKSKAFDIISSIQRDSSSIFMLDQSQQDQAIQQQIQSSNQQQKVNKRKTKN